MNGKTGWMAAAIMFVATLAQATTLTVTDIKVAQRYPWNGLVDITYTVNCDDATKDVWVYPVGYDADNDKTVAMMPAHLTGDGVGKAVKSGTHRMTWDMATAMGENYNRAAFSVKMHAFCDAAPYMVIDLSSGSESEKYEVSYLAEEPEGGWGEEYLTTKMVFRLILPGRSQAYRGGDITVESPYYFAIYPITERQWVLVYGGTSTSMAKKRGVSYDTMRGRVLGAKWPTYQQVDASSMIGKLRLRTGMTIDLPTYSQWIRAARADCHASIVNPNAWGIRQLGEIGEWCVDRCDSPSNTRVVCGRYYPDSETKSPYASLGGYNYGCEYWEAGYNSGVRYNYIYSDDVSVEYGSDTSYTNPKNESIGVRLVVNPVSK